MAIVTGSGGIGRTLALRFADEGAAQAGKKLPMAGKVGLSPWRLCQGASPNKDFYVEI